VKHAITVAKTEFQVVEASEHVVLGNASLIDIAIDGWLSIHTDLVVVKEVVGADVVEKVAERGLGVALEDLLE
tara:strand:+ start:337 stop:555 length:219 start_codon:yes stop_codon:yes gene_type:complete